MTSAKQSNKRAKACQFGSGEHALGGEVSEVSVMVNTRKVHVCTRIDRQKSAVCQVLRVAVQQRRVLANRVTRASEYRKQAGRWRRAAGGLGVNGHVASFNSRAFGSGIRLRSLVGAVSDSILARSACCFHASVLRLLAASRPLLS